MSQFVLVCPKCERHNPLEEFNCWKCDYRFASIDWQRKREQLKTEQGEAKRLKRRDAFNQSSEVFTGTLQHINWSGDYSATLLFEEFDTEFSFTLKQPWAFEIGDKVQLYGVPQAQGFIKVVAAKNQSSGVIFHDKPLPRWLTVGYGLLMLLAGLLSFVNHIELLLNPKWALIALTIFCAAVMTIVQSKPQYSTETQRALVSLDEKP